MTEITLQLIRTLDDMQSVVALQRIYWGESAESVIPAHMLFSIAQYGGHVLAAMDGPRMVGLLVGMLGTSEEATRLTLGQLVVFSKRMLVLPDYRGFGIATRLKRKQRDLVLEQGIQTVTWTYDPLLVANAHLNLHKLGAVATKYHVDLYGKNESNGLAVLGTSDRFKLEWWVGDKRVTDHAEGRVETRDIDTYLAAGAFLVTSETYEDLPVTDDVLALVDVPLHWRALVNVDPQQALKCRLETRAIFGHMLANGFLVNDFVRDENRGYYVLQREAQV